MRGGGFGGVESVMASGPAQTRGISSEAVISRHGEAVRHHGGGGGSVPLEAQRAQRRDETQRAHATVRDGVRVRQVELRQRAAALQRAQPGVRDAREAEGSRGEKESAR
jgi:hypothetical protein